MKTVIFLFVFCAVQSGALFASDKYMVRVEIKSGEDILAFPTLITSADDPAMIGVGEQVGEDLGLEPVGTGTLMDLQKLSVSGETVEAALHVTLREVAARSEDGQTLLLSAQEFLLKVRMPAGSSKVYSLGEYTLTVTIRNLGDAPLRFVKPGETVIINGQRLHSGPATAPVLNP